MLTFDFKPGTNFQYSGEGFVYLARALKKKFNKSLAELADSILFKPLGMKDSRLYWDENMDEKRFAEWHDSEGNLHNPSTSRDRGVNAAGSLLSTVEDFCKFEIDVMKGAGLSPDLYEDMITIHEPSDRGLGWGVIRALPNGEYVIHHDGSDRGVQTSSVILPESGRALVVLTNGDNGMLVWRKVIIEALDVGRDITNSFFGTKTHEIINLPDPVLQQYTGKFIDNFDKVYTIVKIENGLHFSGKGVPTLKLYPETEQTFFPEEFEFQFDYVTRDSVVVSVEEDIRLIINRIK
jgi:CubicO group peptidase (beta-lactamase class C family)